MLLLRNAHLLLPLLYARPAACVHAQAILAATQRSFAAMKRRLGSKTATGIFYMERPFFDVDIELKARRAHRQGRA